MRFWFNFGLTHEELSRVLWAMAFQSCICHCWLLIKVESGPVMCVLNGNLSVIDTRNAIDGSILDRIMEGCSIFGNRTPRRNRVFFSQKAGHMDFMV